MSSPERPNPTPFEGEIKKIEGTNANYLADSPEVIIRRQSLEGVEATSEYTDMYKRGKQMLNELTDFGIATPKVDLVIGHDEDKKTTLFVVTERIHGQLLSDALAEASEEEQKQAEELYLSLIRYYRTKFEKGGDFMTDITANHQYIYGRRAHEDHDRIYLSDIEPRFDHYDAQNSTPENEYLFLNLNELNFSIERAEKASGKIFGSARGAFDDFLDSVPQSDLNYHHAQELLSKQPRETELSTS